MKILRNILGAAKEVREEAHGERLLQEVNAVMSILQQVDRRVQAAAMNDYLEIRGRLADQMVNWTSEGRLELAQEMQSKAKSQARFDMAGGYSKWLAAAWLECQERRSLKAAMASQVLDSFAEFIANPEQWQRNYVEDDLDAESTVGKAEAKRPTRPSSLEELRASAQAAEPLPIEPIYTLRDYVTVTRSLKRCGATDNEISDALSKKSCDRSVIDILVTYVDKDFEIDDESLLHLERLRSIRAR